MNKHFSGFEWISRFGKMGEKSVIYRINWNDGENAITMWNFALLAHDLYVISPNEMPNSPKSTAMEYKCSAEELSEYK